MFEKNALLVIGDKNVKENILEIMLILNFSDVSVFENSKHALDSIVKQDSSSESSLELVIASQRRSPFGGVCLIRQLRQLGDNIPVILLCDNLEPAEQKELLATPKVYLLEKKENGEPFTTKDLQEAITVVVGPRKERAYTNDSFVPSLSV